MLKYESWRGRAVMLNPFKAFKPDIQEIEYRRDPLTGHIVVIARGRSQYAIKYFVSDRELIEELVRSSEAKCPFCPSAIEEETPKFPPEVLPEGRLRIGNCWAVPALFAHADFNAIIVLGEEHFRPLDGFGKDLLLDGLRAGVEILERAHKAYPSLENGTIIMNYMPPGGSSQIHPHLQVLVTKEPFNKARELLSASLRYYKATSSCFWAELVREEVKRSTRFLNRMGRTYWLVPFAPERRYEVVCVVEGVSSLLELSDEDLAHMADGTSRVLRFYSDMGILAFNMAFLSGPLSGEAGDYFWLNLRICARFGLRKPFLSDFWALPALLDTDEIFEAPEDYANRLRPYFKR